MLIGAEERGRVLECCSWFESDSPLKAGREESMSEPLANFLIGSPEDSSRLSGGSELVSAEFLNSDGG